MGQGLSLPQVRAHALEGGGGGWAKGAQQAPQPCLAAGAWPSRPGAAPALVRCLWVRRQPRHSRARRTRPRPNPPDRPSAPPPNSLAPPSLPPAIPQAAAAWRQAQARQLKAQWNQWLKAFKSAAAACAKRKPPPPRRSGKEAAAALAADPEAKPCSGKASGGGRPREAKASGGGRPQHPATEAAAAAAARAAARVRDGLRQTAHQLDRKADAWRQQAAALFARKQPTSPPQLQPQEQPQPPSPPSQPEQPPPEHPLPAQPSGDGSQRSARTSVPNGTQEDSGAPLPPAQAPAGLNEEAEAAPASGEQEAGPLVLDMPAHDGECGGSRRRGARQQGVAGPRTRGAGGGL
jgi:hypothetical protein